MALGIEGAYSKDYIVLGERQSGLGDITHRLNMLPVGRRGVAPQDSYPVANPPGEGSQASVESFCSPLVNRRTLAGGAGADASAARVAALRRATFAV